MFDRQKEYKRVLRFKRLKELAKGRDTDNKLKESENKKNINRECSRPLLLRKTRDEKRESVSANYICD